MFAQLTNNGKKCCTNNVVFVALYSYYSMAHKSEFKKMADEKAHFQGVCTPLIKSFFRYKKLCKSGWGLLTLNDAMSI